MRRRILMPLLLLIIVTLSSCKIKNEDFHFYECKYELINFGFSPKNNRWINSKKEAQSSKLSFEEPSLNKRDLDSLYMSNAHFVFIIGGGGNYVDYKECIVEINDNSLIINYKLKPGPSLGESASSLICLELNKQKYPNYRKMNVILKRVR